MGRNTRSYGGRPTRLGRVVESWEASGTIRLEPRANGVLVAVQTPGNLWDTPTLRIESDVVTTLGEVWPGTARLFSMGVFLR